MSEKKFHPSVELVKGSRLIEKYDIDSSELVQMVEGGLPAYDPETRESLVDETHLDSETLAELKKNDASFDEISLSDFRHLAMLRELGTGKEAKSWVQMLLFKPDEFLRLYNEVEDPVISEQLNDKSDIPQEVIDFVTKVKPQAIEIYISLKQGPGWNKGDKPEGKKARMEDALNFYDENKDELGLLNRGLLEDSALYDRSYTQDKRDIVGRILKKAVELNDLGQHSARKLYKIC